MVGIFTPAYLKAATLTRAVQSFKVTGIESYDPDVFTEANFLASSVTDRKPVIAESEPRPSMSSSVDVNSSHYERPTDATMSLADKTFFHESLR